MLISHIAAVLAVFVVTTTDVVEAFVVKSAAAAEAQTRVSIGTSTPEAEKVGTSVAGVRAEESYPERLQNFEKYWKDLSTERPGYTKQFWALRAAVRKPDGPLDTKTKELIALAISVASTCDTCIAHHVYDALEAGASREEIADALGVVALMSGGVGVAYATHAMRAVDQFEEMMEEKQDEDTVSN